MGTAIIHLIRLVRAGLVFARYDAFAAADSIDDLPRSARALMRLGRFVTAWRRPRSGEHGLAAAMIALGPSYIKLGQFLATRPDIVGAEQAEELSRLQDRLPPFSQNLALNEIRRGLQTEPDTVFAEIGEPIAAASIAQVHKAVTRGDDGGMPVAVKVLRPAIEERFEKDLASFVFAARAMEYLSPAARRLRPVDAVNTLARSVYIEMDLRMEAAAMSEMAGNVAGDGDFRIPRVDWARTSRRVLTTEWVNGTPLGDIGALQQRGVDLPHLADTVIQSFLRHAIRDGFFHADMHQGNLFVDDDGVLAAVDFGIMGRLSIKDRRFLAEILWGFVERDYHRVSQVHFEAGYVPPEQSPEMFAQALRAIGEPIMDKRADEISMARLLGQLFHVTEQFNMHTQPQLLLLQKTMVVVEGVARTLNPHLNMWETAAPVVRQWVEQRLGPEGRLHDAAESAATLGKVLSGLPELLTQAERTSYMLAQMAASGGIRLDRSTTESLAEAQARHNRFNRAAMWVAALALVVIAIAQFS